MFDDETYRVSVRPAIAMPSTTRASRTSIAVTTIRSATAARPPSCGAYTASGASNRVAGPPLMEIVGNSASTGVAAMAAALACRCSSVLGSLMYPGILGENRETRKTRSPILRLETTEPDRIAVHRELGRPGSATSRICTWVSDAVGAEEDQPPK